MVSIKETFNFKEICLKYEISVFINVLVARPVKNCLGMGRALRPISSEGKKPES
jgi:hypothetical protein